MTWVIVLCVAVLLLSFIPKYKATTVTRPHRGIEMMADNGRIVYFRETGSEREI